MKILSKKKRFNFVERSLANRLLQEDLEKYQPLKHSFKFLKLFNSNFYFVGKIQNVKTVYLIPYTTKRGYMSFRKKYYPFDLLKENRVNIFARFTPAILLYFVTMFLLLTLVLTLPSLQYIYIVLQYLLMFSILPLAFVGIGSLRNDASGDAALRFAFETLESLTPSERNTIGFVFANVNQRQTVTNELQLFFKQYNKNPLVIEPMFFSGGEKIGIGYNKFESKLGSQLSKKYQLAAKLLDPIQEYYNYKRYLILSFGQVDLKSKDKDFKVQFNLKNKETLDENQYQQLKQLLLDIGLSK